MRICLFLLVAAFSGWMAAGLSHADETPAADAPQPEAQEPAKPRVVSKETTRIVRPLRPDGYPDYIAALNEHYSRGVTPENNAEVSLRQAMGPGEIPEELRGRYFQLLGIARLPEEGEYFSRFRDYSAIHIGARGELPPDKQLEQAVKKPWSAEQFPVVAGWLEANKKPLRLIRLAVERPRYFAPLSVADNRFLLTLELPEGEKVRDAGRALAAQAMLRLHEEEIDEAWNSLLACHRLARLISQGPTLMETFFARAIEQTACTAEIVLAHHTTHEAKTMRKWLEDLEELPEKSPLVERLDVFERYACLDIITGFAREGFARMGTLIGGNPTEKITVGETVRDALFQGMVHVVVDWDEVLRIANSSFDRIVHAARNPPRSDHGPANDDIYEELRAMSARTEDPRAIAMALISGESPRKMMTKRLASELLTGLLPGTHHVRLERQHAARVRLTHVAFALGGYRADHGGYPGSLSELLPEHIAEMLKDPFAEEDFRYQRRGGGYLLYSVGPNGKDDGGRNRKYDDVPEERQDHYEGDDIAIHVPPKKP